MKITTKNIYICFASILFIFSKYKGTTGTAIDILMTKIDKSLNHIIQNITITYRLYVCMYIHTYIYIYIYLYSYCLNSSNPQNGLLKNFNWEKTLKIYLSSLCVTIQEDP